MTAQSLQAGLAAMAAQDGLTGCALVDLATGMVLQRAGPEDQLPIAEAATDYWRLCGRQVDAFGALGAPRAFVVVHERTRVTIVRCGAGLLLVTLSLESHNVDWLRWKRSVHQLQQIADSL